MIERFLEQVIAVHKSGVSTEHSFRPALQDLFNTLDPDVTATNEPRRVEVGAPDFIFTYRHIPIGHCEAKDLRFDIKHPTGRSEEQKTRYLGAFPNLIYTNCLEWLFYRNGQLVEEIRIADWLMGIQPLPDRFAALENRLKDFVTQRPVTITRAEDLAGRMASKARLIKDVFARTLDKDVALDTDLGGQFKAFRELLVHDITLEQFADIYAETIAYGMFAARLHDPTPDSFSRQEAVELLPKSNPFLRKLFQFVAGADLDDRLRWVVEDLADIFRAADVAAIMEDFGKATRRDDPFVHFYETFLTAYDPARRKARGVWYTPQPVVNFIVRAVDDVLKTDFGLADGLADTAKVTIDYDTGQTDKKGRPLTETRQVHRVQILDPATGTGTFLAEVVRHIAPHIVNMAPAAWSAYVERDLIPRLHGFELLMASYAMCHMKLDMILSELGYTPSDNPPRLSVYLTNTLEEGTRDIRDLFMARWLSEEAKLASEVKRDKPIMCVIGNPPYSGESQNKDPWIMDLMEVYKKEPGGKQKLKERNPKWINDDYVKFIRFAEHMIEKTGEGVLGFITNHGYLDNPTFRGMRWHLLNSFDAIHVIDLHGNAKKKEVSPDGTADKNVFDIQQGVAVIIAVKRPGAAQALATVHHQDLWGARAAKYEALAGLDLRGQGWQALEPRPPHYAFIPRDWALEEAYEQGFAVNAFMPVNSVGIVTARDALTIDEDRETLWQRVSNFAELEPEQARAKYNLGRDVQDWGVEPAQKDVADHFSQSYLAPLCYRPFDNRWTYFTGTSRGFLCRPRTEVMRHFLAGENVGMLLPKQTKDNIGAFVTSSLSGHKSYSGFDITTVLPLYLYPNENDLDQTRRVNFDPKLHKKLVTLATHPAHGAPDEVAIFDYIYAVLHCPVYRETYADFLKRDFPRIPWPETPDIFWDLVPHGTALRRLHLIEDAAIGATPYPFTGEEGDSIIAPKYPQFRDGAVWGNEHQRFETAPQVSWDFWIGGYQPAQKWLKDRRGRALSFDDIRHYQKILKILAETARIMAEIHIPGLGQAPS